MRTAPLFCAGLLGLLAGCGGGGASVEAQSTSYSTTLGQELIDLDRAHEKGIISDSEYQSTKKKILKRAE